MTGWRKELVDVGMQMCFFFHEWFGTPPHTQKNILWPGKMSMHSLYTNVHSFQWKTPDAFMHIITSRMLFSKMYHWLSRIEQKKWMSWKYWILVKLWLQVYPVYIWGGEKSEEFLYFLTPMLTWNSKFQGEIWTNGILELFCFPL